MLALGSGDPTRAICSTLIAQAFQSVRYPILPIIESIASNDPMCPGCIDEILHVRHHSLFVPRDFDVSPYFEVVKPALAPSFDHHALVWSDRQPAVPAALSSARATLRDIELAAAAGPPPRAVIARSPLRPVTLTQEPTSCSGKINDPAASA